MALATWWRGDIVPPLPPLPDFRAVTTGNAVLLAWLAGLPVRTVGARIQSGNRPYVAWVGSTPVAYGWSARTAAEVGEYRLAFRVPRANRYLWDFATLPSWRGRGIYPRLLQAIMARERDAQRFWIIHLPENMASERGIRSAGLRAVGELASLSPDHIGLVADAATDRTQAGAALLAVPLLLTSRVTALANGLGQRTVPGHVLAPLAQLPAADTARVRRVSSGPV